MAHAAWQRDIQNIIDRSIRRNVPISSISLQFLAARLRETLEPGAIALREIGTQVENADQVEREAMHRGDKRFKNVHPNAGMTIRQRIELILNATTPTIVGPVQVDSGE